MAIYSTSTKGIGGQIKRRYTDFIVEEIQRDGKVCEAKRFVKEFGEQESAGIQQNLETAEQLHLETEKLIVPQNLEDREQLHLDLEKINRDTNFVIRDITRFIQCSGKRIGYAGMKDKRAVTCQRISIFRPNVERLQQFSSRGIQLRNPFWEKERIDLGMLLGNKFTVTIRDLQLEEKELKKRIAAFFKEAEKNGIANYFGEQRFGGIRNITHVVGKEFLKGDFRNGVMLYLCHAAEGEEEEVAAARKRLAETNDFAEATRLFPPKFRYERAMIHHLCRFPNDFVGAFGRLPKKLRYLFTHAYQSHLFNKIIEERFSQGIGLKNVEGDILEEGNPTAALFGFESQFAEGKAGEIERKVLNADGIELQQFKVKKMAEISSKGARKSIVLKPEKMGLLEIKEDEFFPEKLCAKISFELSKGNYATTVLAELMKIGQNGNEKPENCSAELMKADEK